MIQISVHLIHSVMRYLKIMPLPIKRGRSVVIGGNTQAVLKKKHFQIIPVPSDGVKHEQIAQLLIPT